ncbi:MAG: response regulator transcription factor [Sphingomonadaceae bacterium]
MEHFEAAAKRGGLKVLVAEEDARLRRIVRLNLEREGFESLEATSLSECQAALQKHEIALVIVSSQLPGFDAGEFSAWLRSHFPSNPIPVVILSFEPEDRLLALRLRIATFWLKPFDPGELIGQVSRLLQTA